MDELQRRRQVMVTQQIAARGVSDARVLAAMAKVPRERFVPPEQQAAAFDDCALPIGHGVTISQPYIVALMSELAQVKPGDRVLEIGTGSGYQAAVLAELGARVYSIERIAPIHERTAALLAELGYAIELRHGDGYAGWPEAAPFAAILLTAAPPLLPEALVEQLQIGGRLVAPVGGRGGQSLLVVEQTEQGPRERRILDVAFVPMLPGLA
ncbi:MAG: protein-L-isoaspartate(D-aspartate) O-methyltransferase [Enhygromyxa sp.]